MDPHVELSKEVKRLLKEYRCLSCDKTTNKVKCALSGHEMPCRADVITSYVKGKKFQKLLARDSSNFEKYKPHLIPSTKKNHEHQLFCMLTMNHVNKTPAHVERHVSGAKYKRALARWEECQRNGTVYRPARGRRKHENNESLRGVKLESADGEESEVQNSDTDSLADLYPAAENDEQDQEASDFEFENMEEENMEEEEENMEESSQTKSEGNKKQQLECKNSNKQQKDGGKRKHFKNKKLEEKNKTLKKDKET